MAAFDVVRVEYQMAIGKARAAGRDQDPARLYMRRSTMREMDMAADVAVQLVDEEVKWIQDLENGEKA